MRRYFLVESGRTDREHTEEAIGQLDNLRSEFLFDLSHQLRTPVTALKLAMDGLFSQLQESLTPSQRDLAGIGLRNIARIVALVENQLNLLQTMAGERGVCRRLVNLDRLLREIPRRRLVPTIEGDGCGEDGPLIEYPPELNAAGPLHTFTDPDLLAAVFDGLIGMGVPQSRPRIRVDYDRHNRNFCFDLNVGLPAHNGVKGMAHDALAATEFESRAYRAVLSRLGGEVTSDGDAASRRIRIKLPRYPKFDAEKDFCGPIRKTCSVSSAVDQATPGESTAVHFVRCDLRDGGERDFLATESVAMGRLLDYTNSILSDGEAVVRGPRRGSLYIILADRTKDELETISGQLRSAGGDAIVDCEYRAIDARERELKVLAGDLELV